MTCSICKSNSHNKRTCQERDKHQTSEHPSKKPRGRPPKNPLPSEVTSAGTIATNTEYHSRTAEPSRRRNSSGRGRGSWRNTTPRKNIFIGYGVYCSPSDGNMYINVPGQGGPFILSQQSTSLGPSSIQASTVTASNHAPDAP